ncbi:MAG: hypothetical protein HOE86_12745, partial [Gemmatimonadetes bacterium]|nr:hypothetical protein [Gemmatimonadota bacterium]
MTSSHNTPSSRLHEPTIESLEAELARERTRFAREQAIERLRAEVLSMRGVSGLKDVALLTYHQALEFKLNVSAMGFFFVNEETQQIVWFSAMENPKKYGITWESNLEEYDENTSVLMLTLPLDDSWEEDLERWRAGEVQTLIRTAEETAAALQDFYDECGFSAPMPFANED